ncbi:MAG: ABC transporter permease subunit [Clostridia bacterium]|jgi:NitT/TauT family transport system permease protein|nr:ABC transporter permease subunit [Clostridia bacterium]
MNKAKKLLLSKKMVILYWVLGLIAVWEVIASIVAVTKRSPENVLPHIYQVIASVFSNTMAGPTKTITQIVISNAGMTLWRAAVGFLIGMAVGYILALLMSLFKTVEKVAFPYLMIIQMIPILGIAPIILAITKNIDASRIIIAAILTFYPVSTNVLAGFKSVQQEKLDLMFSLAAKRKDVYMKLMVPASMPYFFTGLKIAAPMAITASILVDTLQGGGGLGCMLSQSLKHAMSIYVFWQIAFLSAIVGILSFCLMGVIEKILSPQRKAKL